MTRTIQWRPRDDNDNDARKDKNKDKDKTFKSSSMHKFSYNVLQ